MCSWICTNRPAWVKDFLCSLNKATAASVVAEGYSEICVFFIKSTYANSLMIIMAIQELRILATINKGQYFLGTSATPSKRPIYCS